MIIRQIVLDRFMSHDASTLDVPEQGLVVVVGPNGSGKSSLIEAVPHALWGKSLRGKLGWRRRKHGSKVTIVASDGTRVSRSRENDTSHIEIVRGGEKRDDDLYDTARKAQPQIDQTFGTFDVWRRTSVFSSVDAAHFSLATDGERKRLLELLLGLERFDAALDACRVALREAQQQVTERAGAVERIETQQRGERARLVDARADLGSALADAPKPPEPEPEPSAPEPEPEPAVRDVAIEVPAPFAGDAAALLGEGEDVDQRVAELVTTRDELSTELADLAEQRAVAEDQRKRVRAELAQLGTDVNCSRCGQDVAHLRPALQAKLDATETAVAAQLEKLARAGKLATDERAKVERDIEVARQQRKQIDDRIAAARRQNEQHASAVAMRDRLLKNRDTEHAAAIAAWRERSKKAADQHAAAIAAWRERSKKAADQHAAAIAAHEDRVSKLRDRERDISRALLDLDDELDEAQADRSLALRDVAELEACEEALGLRGIRAHVLGRALTGIESVANYWLSTIVGPGLKLALKPYSEKKTGGVNDMISLSIEGAGEGDYLGASGGERRRFDVAILLALAEVARAAAGTGAGTLFFDEVFDALDQDGQQRVASALRDIADERAVFVVTHSEELARNLHADLFVHVKEGKLRVMA